MFALLLLVIYCLSISIVGVEYDKINMQPSIWSVSSFIIPGINTIVAIYCLIKLISKIQLKGSFKDFISKFKNSFKYSFKYFISKLKDI